MPNSLVSTITVPDSTGVGYVTYDIKDAWAREQIGNIGNVMNFLGVTTTELIDGSTTNPVMINNVSTTAAKGDVVIYDTREFVWDGAKWCKFGDVGDLKAFAFVDVGHVEVTPSGTVSAPTFTGSSSSVSFSISKNASGNYTPTGTVTAPEFVGETTPVTITANEATSPDDYNFQPAGTINTPSFSGTISGTATGDITVVTGGSVTATTTPTTVEVKKASSGTATYTPAGEISAITVTPTTGTVQEVTNAGTLPTLKSSYTAATEDLKLILDQGTLPTVASATVVTGITSVSTPTFTGTAARLTATVNLPTNYTFTPSTGTITPSLTVSGTCGGTIPTLTFTGTKYKITGSCVPNGHNEAPTFSGDKVKITGTVTPNGSVSAPTFTGTAESWTVYPGPIPTP